jgi:hypothetical protein
MVRLISAAAAAALLLISAAPASADPPPADPGGVAPVAATPAPAPAPAAAPWAAPAPGAPAPAPAAAPVAAPAVDTGRTAPAPPATMTTSDGAVLTVFGEDESRTAVPALTTAITSRDYDVDGIFRASITGSNEPAKGLFEVGYQIGCGIDMGTGPGVLIGGNLGANTILGLAGVIPDLDTFIPNVGVSGGGIINVSLKPGVVYNVPVTKKQFKGESPRVAIRDVRVKIDGCVGESFIRSYAVLGRVTDEKDSVLAWYGETTRV